MKKIGIIFSLLVAVNSLAQENKETINLKAVDTVNNYNRWSIEGMFGVSDGNRPYGIGFNSGEKKQIFSQVKLNSFDVGVRYMLTPKFGLKGNLAYNTYTENDNSTLPYKTTQLSLAFQGVINAARVFDFKGESRFGLLLHGGIYAASITSKTKNIYDETLAVIPNGYYNAVEYHGGFVGGITPQYRISDKLALFLDISMYYNYRQHMNWDGTENLSKDLTGKYTNLSFGLSYSLGNDNIHGDWRIIKKENEQKIEALQDELKRKIEDIEVMLQDTDRDGVVDYLDVENNTIGGVAVDTKGRAIDVNKNGVPDELEPRRNKNNLGGNGGVDDTENNESASFDYLIKQGMVNIFFNINQENPNSASANNLYYIIQFLKAYPQAKVKVKGYADTSGNEKANANLAKRRADNIANFIIKSGVDANRIEVLGVGVDTNFDNSSKTSLQLARRVSFELIKE
jgi:OOP family OmpA-OmpF porin